MAVSEKYYQIEIQIEHLWSAYHKQMESAKQINQFESGVPLDLRVSARMILAAELIADQIKALEKQRVNNPIAQQFGLDCHEKLRAANPAITALTKFEQWAYELHADYNPPAPGKVWRQGHYYHYPVVTLADTLDENGNPKPQGPTPKLVVLHFQLWGYDHGGPFWFICYEQATDTVWWQLDRGY